MSTTSSFVFAAIQLKTVLLAPDFQQGDLPVGLITVGDQTHCVVYKLYNDLGVQAQNSKCQDLNPLFSLSVLGPQAEDPLKMR